MRTVNLPGGEAVPVLGLGTWYMGESRSEFDREVAAVRHAMGRGIRLIDTAEMYGNGGAEEVVGAAIADGGVAREDLFIVSKVLPSNAHHDDVIAACERSLSRMGTDYIDLYLLHWRGAAPFQETLDALDALKTAGKIRHHGVSNFDKRDMEEWLYCRGGSAMAMNQILYNLGRRGPEWDIMPFCEQLGVPVMAYSPLEQGRLAGAPVLSEIARRQGVQPLQIALAWVLAQDNVIAIPKAVDPDHIDQNIAALEIRLSGEDMAALDAAFPPPKGPSHLQML
ncbi:MAG: aldo/keto reductase [Rhodospirillales bacterium]|nr:aldo/keto reductase [Rhodospirillales bacterium]MBO6788300.1 aldo/keto reductase [Rhodospirillales bacterium]